MNKDAEIQERLQQRMAEICKEFEPEVSLAKIFYTFTAASIYSFLRIYKGDAKEVEKAVMRAIDNAFDCYQRDMKNAKC